MILPARNEATHLPATLQALADQVDLRGRPLDPNRFEVLLLINNTSDDSRSVVDQFRARFPLWVAERHFDAEHAHIGHVRKLLMDCACRRLRSANGNALILSTDADTEVAPDWIARNLLESSRGAEAVGGRISLHLPDFENLDPQTRNIQYWDDRYQILLAWLEDRCDPQPHDRWPRHHQHFGGSLAVRPEIYRKVGGLPPRRALEDVAFYEALARHDVKIRHSPAVSVRTSGRLQGRTDVGLAEQLLQWSKTSSAISVRSVEFSRAFFSLRNRLRVYWNRMRSGEKLSRGLLQRLALNTGCRPEEIHQALSGEYFGAAFESLGILRKLEAGMFQGVARQTLQRAVEDLEAQANWIPQPPPFAPAVQYGIGSL